MLKLLKVKYASLAGLFIFSLVAQPVFAETSSTSQADMQQITERTQSLEQEVKSLQQELKRLKKQNQCHKSQCSQQYENNAPEKCKSGQACSVKDNNEPTHIGGTADLSRPYEPASLSAQLPALLYLGGTPVLTSPYLGTRSEFNASDLIVNIPSVNEDLRLLQQWQRLMCEYKKYKQDLPNRPFVELSGKIETQAFAMLPYKGAMNSGVDLSAAEVDVLAQVNRYALAFIAFKFDNSQTSPQTTANSNVFLDKGFLSIGDLSVLPIYFTMGQAYVPFGLYSTNMLSSTLPQDIFRTKQRYMQLGYAQPDGKNFYGAVYASNGNTTTSASAPTKLQNGGLNLGFANEIDKINYDVGAGVIANIADSDGMQNNNATSGFTGFAQTSETEVIDHLVPGADVHANFGYGQFGLATEYIRALTSFDASNLTYDGHGARPSAFNIEGSYSFEVWHKPTAFSVGYQQSKQALALLVPEKRFIAAINTSIWKQTIESLEYRHDINYGSHDTATGQGMTVDTNGLGNSSDQVTMQIGVYF